MEWISVKDRLPESDNYVVYCRFSDDIISDWGFAFWCESKEKWYGIEDESPVMSNGGRKSTKINSKDITHWFPLTKPMK
jgi:uncharacterized protein YbaR (Trm112 family)